MPASVMKAASERRALRALVFGVVLLLSLALSAPALALTTNKATARSNEDGGNGVIGGLPTRLTWEGTVGDDEEVTSVTLELPEGGNFENSSTKVTVLDGLTRIPIEGVATADGEKLVVDMAEPIPSGSLLRIEVEGAVFPAAGGDVSVGGTYTTSDRLYSLIQFNSLSEGGRQATATITHLKDTLAWNDVTGKVTLNFGGYAKFSIEAISAKISEAGLRLEAGIREELEAQLKPDEYKLQNIVGLDGELLRLAVASNQEKARKLYDFMDRNVSVNWALFANGQVYAKIGNAQLTFKKEYTISNTPQGGLVPH